MNNQRSKPTHEAFVVRNFERDGEQDASWLKVGAAFAHRDGKGFDIVLDAMPVTGRVVVREVRERNRADESGNDRSGRSSAPSP